jgi:group I intron endonuclease
MTLNNLHNMYNKDIMVVYLVTNKINNKKYIGKDTNNRSNYLGSGTYIKQAIQKYGKHNFEKTILEYCNSKEELILKEEYWLKKFDAENNPEFYNKTNKSFGNSGQTEEGKKRISIAKKGWKPTEEQKIKMSENRKGHSMYTEEWKQKISKSTQGIKKSEEWKELMKEKMGGNTNRRKKVIQYDMERNFIKEWDYVLEAAHSLGKSQGAGITEVCNGNRKSIYGYIWEYKKI